jgi:hypothetical protein
MGGRAELAYLDLLKDKRLFPHRNYDVHVVQSHSDSKPMGLLCKMNKDLKVVSQHPPFEAWFMVDEVGWEDAELVALCKWTQEDGERRFLALSNPKFEYWLLLHCEEGNDITSPQECDERLAACRIGRDSGHKPFNDYRITREMMEDAVRRAEERDRPPCEDWPRQPGNTTVYKLVKKLLDLSEGR